MYASLPKREKTFTLEIVGEESGILYKGEFTVRSILSMSGKHSLELEKTRMMADFANPSRGLAGISISLATIRVKLIKAPDWWYELGDGADILDENVIIELYDRTVLIENEWRNSVAKQAEESKKEQEKENKEKEESEGK
jgi:hypothetical protein